MQRIMITCNLRDVGGRVAARAGTFGRRRLLGLAGLAASVAAGAACSEEKSNDGVSRGRLRPSSAPAAAAPTPDPALRQFLALSAAITGVTELDPVAGQRYMAALQARTGGMSLAQLYQSAGVGDGTPAPSFNDVVSKGVLNQPGARVTLDALARAWYSGQVPGTNGGQTTVTYNRALGWQALGFAGAPGRCGGEIGFWTSKPS